MHKLIALLLAFISMLLVLVGKGMAAFTNLDPTTSGFTTASMIPGYRDSISRQWGELVVNNTGYNYTQVLNRWYEKVHISEGFTSLQERNYDPGNSWVSAYIFAISDFVADTAVYNRQELMQLSGNYEPLFVDAAANSGAGGWNFTIKHLAGGGFRIKNNDAVATSLTCFIIRIRHITGIPV